MPRKAVKKRTIPQDSVYHDELVSKFINELMIDGKKSVAERGFYNAMEYIKKKTKSEGIDVFRKAIENVKPVLEVKSRRVGGATYQVPIEVRQPRRQALGIKWLVKMARGRKEASIVARLAEEFIDASNKKGNSIKKKEDTHKMAEANKAFAHFRW